MKKYMLMFLALMMASLLGSSALAQEYYTLPEIREQAEQGWHETYTDKYGRETVVDIELEVFGQETAPVLKVDQPHYVNKGRDDGWYIKKKNYPYSTIAEVRKKKGIETKYLYNLTNGSKMDLDMIYGEEYGNTMTLRDVYAILEADIIQRDKTPDDYCWDMLADFGMVCCVKENTGEVVAPAFYTLSLWSEMYDLPILTNATESFDRSVQAWYNSEVMYVVRNENEYGIYDRSFTLEEVLAQDIPLCSVEQVIKSIEGKIEAGHIQEVYSLRFGYSIYCDPIVPYNKRVSGLEAKCYYLVPSWVLDCEFMSEPKKDYDSAESRTAFTINAQTGKILGMRKRATKDANASYVGFISWDDVN